MAVITARGASKRIPNKNIKEFMGKPMLAYAIEAALRCAVFDTVMVSTDSERIAAVAKQYGASVPFMRSQKNSNDFATTYEVLAEVTDEYKKRGNFFDWIGCIYPCVPFLTGTLLKDAYKKFEFSDAESLMAVIKYSHPIQRALKLNNTGYLVYREPEYKNYRTQDLETTYHDAGMFYFYRNLRPTRTIMYEIDELHAEDIDSPEDWDRAELKYQILHAK